MTHLDQELCGPRLTRGVAGIRDDVQSDFGPCFLERMSSRRLWGKSSPSTTRTPDICLRDIPGIRRHIALVQLSLEYGGCQGRARGSDTLAFIEGEKGSLHLVDLLLIK